MLQRQTFYRLLLTSLILVVVSLQGMSQGSKKNLQKQKANLENDIANTSKLIKETQKNSKKTTQQIQLIESQVRNYEELVEKTGSEMDMLEDEISKKKNSSSKLMSELNTLKEQYARMVYYAYLTRRPANRLVYLFSSKSFVQAWRRMRYFREYSAIRKRQVTRIVDTRSAVERIVKELESMRNEKLGLMTDQERQMAELSNQRKEKDKMVKDLKKQEKQLRADLNKKQKESADIQKKIQKLIEEEIEASRKKQNVVKVNNSNQTTNNTSSKPVVNTYQMTPAEAKISNTFAGNKGGLPWPVAQGTITSRFGVHPHPVLPEISVKNNGIDITCPAGSSARAIFEGTVSAVITAPNGTRLVMIRHGEYLSVYSNISSTSLKSGSTVTAKQTIGAIATDENSSVVLHFEVWKEKEPQNPESWLSK